MATGYQKNINDRIKYMNVDRVVAFCKEIGATITSKITLQNQSGEWAGTKSTTYNNTSNNITIKMPNGKIYELHNTNPGDAQNYNRLDVIAMAKAAGLSNERISRAFQNVYEGTEWKEMYTPEFISNSNLTTTPAAEQIKETIETQYKGSNVFVETHLREDGEGYTYKLVYTSKDGTRSVHDVPAPKNGKTYDTASEELTNNLINTNSGVPNFIAQAQANSAGGFGYGTTGMSASDAEDAYKELGAITKNLATGTESKTNYNLTDKHYKAGTVKAPDANTQVIGNKVNNTKWTPELMKQLATSNGESFAGRSLSEFINSANNINDNVTKLNQTELDKSHDAVTSDIQKDAELYKALSNILNTNSTAGQRAQQLLEAAQASNQEYKATADSLNEVIGGTGENSLTSKERAAIYGNLKSAFEGYTDQQLNQMLADANIRLTDSQDFLTLAALIAGGIGSENAKLIRQGEVARTNAENATSLQEASDEADASINRAKADSTTQTSVDAFNAFAEKLGSDAYNYNASSGKSKTKGTTYKPSITKVTPNTVDPNYANEDLLQQMINSGVIDKLLDTAYFNNLMGVDSNGDYTKDASSLAKDYGVDYLTDKNKFGEHYVDFATQANTASDRMLNQAQKAYLSAIATGDIKTIQQLTKLADTSTVSQRDLYKASALAAQFAQQRENSNVGNVQAQERIMQESLNKQAIDNALNKDAFGTTGGWNRFQGDGSATGTGLTSAQTLHGQATNNIGSGYGTIIDSGLSSRTTFNDEVARNVNKTNTNLTSMATRLTGNNATGAVNNIDNSTAIANLKQKVKDKKGMLKNIIENGA